MSPKPTILLISLGKPHIFDEMYSDLLSALKAHSEFKEVISSKDIASALSTLKPSAVLITNPNFARVQHQTYHEQIVGYAKAGGTVVLCGLFSGICSPTVMEKHFQNVWGLPWTVGSFNRTIFSLNKQRPARLQHKSDLPSEIEMKAVRIKGAAKEDVVYSTTPDSMMEHLAMAQSAHKPDEAAVVFTPIGNGYLGYIGDVGAESDTTDIVLAMCGLPA